MSDQVPTHTNAQRIRGLVGPLSLVPLLGGTDSLVRALGLLMALWLVSTAHMALMRAIRSLLSPALRTLASAVLAAALVSCVELAMQAYALALYQGLGIYLPLISIHCVLRNCPGTAANESNGGEFYVMTLFSTLALTLALLRELLGSGTLFSHAQWLLGSGAANGEIIVFSGGLHLALLTPGAFILLGMLLAAKNFWTERSSRRQSSDTER